MTQLQGQSNKQRRRRLHNRSNAKAMLRLKNEARKDFETALELAQKAGNTNIVGQAEQSLRGLDADGGR